jgi:signal transduction histidine kinase/ligand-binding sensor domain-containing protein
MNLKPRSFISLRIRLIFFIVLSFSIETYSQLNTGNFTQFTEKDGLPGVQVNDLLIDRLGYVWTGTVNGLAQYDGYTFKRFYFNPNDTNTLHGLEIWGMLEDRKGQIWISSIPSFLDVYNPIDQKFRQYKFADLLPHSGATGINVREMCEDDNGRIYFGLDTYDGDSVSTPLLYKNENEEQLKIFPVPADMHMLNIYRLKKDNSGNVWIFSWKGIFKIDKHGKLSRFQVIDKEFGNNDGPGDLNFDKQGHMWIISQQLKLIDIDLETFTYKTWYSKELYRTNNSYWAPRKIVFDKDENIWMGTNGGLQFFDRRTEQFAMFTTGPQKELEHMIIDDLSFDSFGTLWISTVASGLVKYDEKTLLKSYTYGNGDKTSLTSGWANNIYEASDGKIWITTSGSDKTSGINILDPHTGDIRKITYPQIQNRINTVQAIWENTPDEYYLGTFNGLYKFSEKTLKLNPVKLAGLPEKSVIISHLKDSKGNEWLCTHIGVYKKEKGTDTYKQYDLSRVNGSNAASNWTKRMLESKKHGLWILTGNGLFLYNYTTNKIERHGYDKNAGDIFVTQDINSLYEDADGIVWVGTWSGGLSKYNVETKKIKTYTRNEGLPSMSIQGILADEKNNALWLSTFEGLSRFNLKTEQFNNFSIADGIQGQLFADGAYLKTSGGLFAFGGSNGITIFNPADVNKSSIPPKVFLTDLKLFDKSIIPGESAILKKPVYETDKIMLSYNQNNLSLEYLALHFSNPALNRYSYKLEGYDNEWRDVGNQRVAFYPNLPPGKYTFHVKAANDKGVWNEKGATLLIIVNKPWWKTTWAYIIYGLLFIVLAFSVDRYVRRRLVQKERERSRARELAQAKEIEKAYNELKTTQAQLIQSEKMASLGELTAGIAHEIQNPLNFVNNFSEVNKELLVEMNEEIEKGNYNEVKSIAKDVTENEEKINHHGKRADAIVKGMLQHSRSSSGVKEPTDINTLADEYLRLAYHGLRAKDKSFNATMKTDFDKTIGNINIIPQDVGRVILNLITNAFYAVTEKKKQIADARPDDLVGRGYEPTVSVSTKKLSDKVEIKVKDNGNGIPQKVMDKIFQPFFTTKPTGQGTGLGLSLSYDIITKGHGGELKVETKEGEFAEFIISLPV